MILVFEAICLVVEGSWRKANPVDLDKEWARREKFLNLIGRPAQRTAEWEEKVKSAGQRQVICGITLLIAVAIVVVLLMAFA